MDEQASATTSQALQPGWVSTETARPQNLSLGRVAFLIVILPMLVYFFADFFFENFANPDIVIPPSSAPVLPESEAANRYFFLTASLALIAITAGICLYFRANTRAILDLPSRRSVRLVGIVLIGLLAYSVLLRGGDSPKTYRFVGEALFAKALCSAPLPKQTGKLAGWTQSLGEHTADPATLEKSLCNGTAATGTMAGAFVPLQKIDDVFMILAVPAVILGCVTALGLPSGTVSYDAEVHILSVQVRRVKAYLYLSALLLLAIVILTISWMTFPSFLLTGDAAKRYDALVHSISAYYGLQYMFILCSYYIPVSLRLSQRIRGSPTAPSAAAPRRRTSRRWKSGSRNLACSCTICAHTRRLRPCLRRSSPASSELCWPWRGSRRFL